VFALLVGLMRGMDDDSQPIQRDDMIAVAKSQSETIGSRGLSGPIASAASRRTRLVGQALWPRR
jgi:hypothetical protein